MRLGPGTHGEVGFTNTKTGDWRDNSAVKRDDSAS